MLNILVLREVFPMLCFEALTRTTKEDSSQKGHYSEKMPHSASQVAQ